jgi:O-antigen/teichoic acid export membrane protein
VSTTGIGATTESKQEVARAIGNGVKLGLSLLSTVALAFAIRFWLPRHLGPAEFGKLHWAEAFAAASFVFVSFGVDMYIRREVSLRPQHASDFYGGVIVLRLLASLGLLVVMYGVMGAMGKDALEVRLAYLFAVGQLAGVFTNTQGTLLNTVGHVNELAILNVVCKLFWAAGIFAGLQSGYGLEVVAIAFAASETVKAVFYHRVLKRRMRIASTIDLRAAWMVVVASTPYFVNLLCHSVYERVGVNMVSVFAGDREVGWYGAAVNLASMTMLFMPVVSLVLMPMGMRLSTEGPEVMNEAMRGALRIVFAVCSLGSVLFFVHADEIVVLLFGAEYAPAAVSLRVLAPMLPVTYVAVVASLQVNVQGRIWTLVKCSVAGLIVNPVVNLLLVKPLHAAIGDGGAGAAAATAALATELVVAGLMLAALGRAALDARTIATFGKTLALCAGVVALDALLPWPGLWWAPLQIALYLVVGARIGALPFSTVVDLVRQALARRRAAKQTASSSGAEA